MCAVEVRDIGRKYRAPRLSLQIRVTSGTRLGTDAGKPQGALMFDVTIRARRHRGLFRVMNGPVVAGEACGVGDLARKRGAADVTSCALVRQQRVRTSERAGAINPLLTRQRRPSEP